MDREIIEKLKQVSARKMRIMRNSELEERLYNEDEPDLIRQLDLERDDLVSEICFNTY